MPELDSGEVGSGTSIYMPYDASGGGGHGGNFVFTDLAELANMITRWADLRERIQARGEESSVAAAQVGPPADDDPSTVQAQTLMTSLTAALDHNDAMVDYAAGYITKLEAARDQYATDDQTAADDIRRAEQA